MYIVGFEVFVAVKIQVVFWLVMLCSVVVGCQCFRGPCCLHLQDGMEMGKTGIDLLMDLVNCSLPIVVPVVRFEVFTAVKIQVEFFWVLMPCSVVGYHCFRGPCCSVSMPVFPIMSHFSLQMEAVGTSETLYSATLHGITTQKTLT
jgi:hypothetical protein